MDRRIRSRRGQHVAAVATARKLTVLVWHLLTKEQDYLWARPSLHAIKLRRLELTAGHASARGRRGAAYDYNIKATRDQERCRVEQAERIYERFVAGWNPSGPKVRTGAAKEERP
jgi:transposase